MNSADFWQWKDFNLDWQGMGSTLGTSFPNSNELTGLRSFQAQRKDAITALRSDILRERK
jgi:hypothetical protein